MPVLTLLLTRVAKTTSTLASQRSGNSAHSGKCRINTFKTVRTHPLQAQGLTHARLTTNLHRATHTENCANCVNCGTNVSRLRVRICSETRLDLLAQQRFRSGGLTELLLAFHPSCMTSSRFVDVSRFVAFCSTIQYPVAIDQSSTRFQISLTRFQIRRDSVSFEYLTPFDLTLDFWRSAFTDSIGPARSQPILLLLQLLIMLKTSKDPWSGCCCCWLCCNGSATLHDVRHHSPFTMFSIICCCCCHDCCNHL